MRLEAIGFYTLSDERARTASATTPLSRCELILTARCNFKCPYCRRVGGKDLALARASRWVSLWAAEGCSAIRFSGGEPTLYPDLVELVQLARSKGIKRIAVSSNGSAERAAYAELLEAGVNDFSISLDACCAADGDQMGMRGTFERVVDNIRWLAERTYVTVGVVLTDDNADKADEVIRFASSLGVADIRVIPAAQDGAKLKGIHVAPDLLARHPILAYRVANLVSGRDVRGLSSTDPARCGLVLDDVASCGDDHFPCVIYMREGGPAIGKIGPNMRAEREAWWREHDVKADPICSKNCLDVCVDYNRKHDVV